MPSTFTDRLERWALFAPANDSIPITVDEIPEFVAYVLVELKIAPTSGNITTVTRFVRAGTFRFAGRLIQVI